MNKIVKSACLAFMACALAACSATTMLTSVQSAATIDVKEGQQASVPRTEAHTTTSFGNYEFRAQAAGADPFYGVLPLKFNGGYLALDILFFAPAMFFNLREVYPQYEFDVEKKVVKFRQKDTDEWSVYTPLAKESDRARQFFGGK